MSKGKRVKDEKGEPIKIDRKKKRFYFIDKEGYLKETKPKSCK